MTIKRQRILYLMAVGIFLLFCILVGWYIGVPMIRLVREPQMFRDWVDSYGIWGRLLFVGMVVLQVLVAFIPGEPVELAAGYAFGVVEGSLLTMAGFLIGSWMVYALVKRFGVRLVEVFFSRDRIAEFRFLKNPKKAKVLAFILMTIPGTPKDFLSYFAGLTPISTKQWLTIVAISRLPSLLSSTISGAAAGTEKYLLSAVVLTVTLLFSLAGVIYYRQLTKQERNAAEAVTA